VTARPVDPTSKQGSQLAAVAISAALGAAGLGLALWRGGVVPWLLAGFLVLAVRVHRRPRAGNLKLVLGSLAAFAGAVVLVAAGAVAIWETAEVVVLRQADEHGEPFSTRLWVIDLDGAPSFLAQPPSQQRRIALLRDHPRVDLVRGGRSECRQALLVDASEADRAEAERLYREKYGFRLYFAGAFVGLLLGGPRSEEPEILVRLDPCAGEPAGRPGAGSSGGGAPRP
jgi:hypothetical protein